MVPGIESWQGFFIIGKNKMNILNAYEGGIYGECKVCKQLIYTYMEHNKEYFDATDMCGACVTGEASEYIDEFTYTELYGKNK